MLQQLLGAGNLIPTDQDPEATYTDTPIRRRLRDLVRIIVVEVMGASPVYAKLLESWIARLSDRQCDDAVTHLKTIAHYLDTGERPEANDHGESAHPYTRDAG